ncbi:MAG TPA: protein-L-isoaspartate(D-aspartate) O-methyltransferase [Pseudonocardiaceae bacterium]|nr:protein-L-isoaspartate(D-aspartate) O-methyltransferase [Pseudonocardiaceae bacterium]
MLTRTGWQGLITEVPRAPFIPDTIWVDVVTGQPQSGFVALSKQDDPQRWQELVGADEPVITQVDEGLTAVGETGWSPSSSCSKPSIVADMLDALDVHPGHSVLEIGTGTGWNAALLCRRVGLRGRVVSIEVDPLIAEAARAALTRTGYSPLVITGDGVEGYPDAAPYDRLLATAAVRDFVPRVWLEQTRPGGLIVTPWGTDYCNGVMLTLYVATAGTVTGRFGGDLAFMRLRAQRRRFYEPDEADIAHAEVTTAEVHGQDFFRMINSDQAAFAIGLRVPHCALTVELHKFGEDHNVLELDDITTKSWARLDANLTSRDKLLVRQLGPRRLWDEAESAYDWWYEHGKPGLARFGMTVTADTQTVWLDEPSTVVRAFGQTG